MQPTLWGPGLWHLLFSIAWNATDLDKLTRVVFYFVPQLLPCFKCQDHYVENHAVLKRRYGEPRTCKEVFHWLYKLKDEVNKQTKMGSIPFKEFQDRYRLHGGRMDDVLVGDTLILMAIHAEDTGEGELFVEFCAVLAELLPLPEDSELVTTMKRVRRPVVTHAYRMCKNTRIEHGIAYPTLIHIRDMAS